MGEKEVRDKSKGPGPEREQGNPSEESLACQKAHRREGKQQQPLLQAYNRKNNRTDSTGLLPWKATLVVAEVGSNY